MRRVLPLDMACSEGPAPASAGPFVVSENAHLLVYKHVCLYVYVHVSDPVVSIDGELVPASSASISVFDRGLLYGDGCFEVLRTWAGVARDLDAHLARLYTTARFLAMDVLDESLLRDAVERSVMAAGAGEHRIRIVLTRGPGGLAQSFAELGRGRAIVIVEPLPVLPTELSLAVVDWPVAPGASHKTLSYLDPLIARELARAAGADEALRLDARGDVVEGATCNVFVVETGSVVTPPLESGALPGVVRARVLALCERLAVPATVRRISIDQFRSADEVFVTSSLRGVVPITRIDGVPRPVGPLTQKLSASYRGVMRSASTVI